MQIRKNRKAFSLVELIVAIAIMAVAAGILVPSFVAIRKQQGKKADDAKFISMANSLQQVMTDNEIEKEVKKISDGNQFDVVFVIDDTGHIDMTAGTIKTATEDFTLFSTKIWKNWYHYIEEQYDLKDRETENMLLVLHAFPRTSKSVPKCNWEVIESADYERPPTVEEEESKEEGD